MSDELRIRMYNVGFGDCFLLSVPSCDGPKLVLYDFGQHISGRARTLSDIAKDIKAEAKKVHGTVRLDVVIATHRHHDHIAGFDLNAMSEFEVGEVWLPWTENPADPKAVDLRTAQLELADSLQKAAADTKDLDLDKLDGFDFVQNSASHQLGLDPDGFSLSNAGAMETLLHGFEGNPIHRFLPDENRDNASFTSPLLPDVAVHALGPAHDLETITKLKPPKGEFFSWVPGDSDRAKPDKPEPVFDDAFRLTPSEHRRRAGHLHEIDNFDELGARARSTAAMAATALEDAVNGTSLVLVMEIGRQVVVLGGDAEWGTWEAILDDDEWVALLERTSLYKVSHHGSYNGTPLRYVEDHMPNDATSMVSLATMKKWPSIPRASLIDALASQERTLVSSRDTDNTKGVVTAIGPKKRNKPLYIDVTLPV